MKRLGMLFVLSLAACAPGQDPPEARLLAGVARVDITPDRLPAPYNIGVVELATAIADPLAARLLYLEDGDDRVLLVALDWEGVLRTAHDELREALSQTTGLPPGNIVVNASHSHNSMWINLDSEALLAEYGYHLVDTDYFRSAVRSIAGAARRAIEGRRPAKVFHGTVQVPGFAFNHRAPAVDPAIRERLSARREFPADVTDPSMPLMRIDDESGRPVAVVALFAAHATTSTGFGTISADYPGVFSRELERALGGGAVALFLQGCGANLSPNPAWPAGSPAAVQQAGTYLAEAALAALSSSLRPVSAGEFSFGVRPTRLPFDPLRGVGSVEALEGMFREEAEAFVARHRRGRPGSHAPLVALADRLTLARNVDAWSRYDLQALCWRDEVCLLSLPGEVFVEYALRIRERAGVSTMLVAAYNDSTPVYIPTAEAFEEGGYEVGPWCYGSPETGATLLAEAMALLESVTP